MAKGDSFVDHSGIADRVKAVPFFITKYTESIGMSYKEHPIDDIFEQWHMFSDIYKAHMSDDKVNVSGASIVRNNQNIYFVTQIFVYSESRESILLD